MSLAEAFTDVLAYFDEYSIDHPDENWGHFSVATNKYVDLHSNLLIYERSQASIVLSLSCTSTISGCTHLCPSKRFGRPCTWLKIQTEKRHCRSTKPVPLMARPFRLALHALVLWCTWHHMPRYNVAASSYVFCRYLSMVAVCATARSMNQVLFCGFVSVVGLP